MYSRPASLTAPEHICDVLPTVAPDLDYGALGEVQKGTTAGRAYLEIIDKQIPNDGENLLSHSRNTASSTPSRWCAWPDFCSSKTAQQAHRAFLSLPGADQADEDSRRHDPDVSFMRCRLETT